MTTQNEKLAALLKRKNGCTAMDIMLATGSVSPHRRLTDLKRKGWVIKPNKIAGKNYMFYTGTPPKAEPEHVPAKAPWPEHNFKAWG